MTSPKPQAPLTPFRHSRIYAEGWNAARGVADGPAANPYKTDPERARWAEGFAAALV